MSTRNLPKLKERLETFGHFSATNANAPKVQKHTTGRLTSKLARGGAMHSKTGRLHIRSTMNVYAKNTDKYQTGKVTQ